ncbi:DUF262 domain-containing protein [Pseudonocardia sp. McavD-2-B]|nr:DUF262 domain-containing protein [Pseudonocardia sp. McavD-2-B]
MRLLDSLASNYPVGSLLLWKTAEKLQTERNIGDFTLPETDDHSPTDYVLDGQQRLTVIYSCLGAPEHEGGFAAGYDLVEEEFIPMTNQAPLTVFPLRALFNTSRLLDFRTALQSRPDKDELQRRLDSLIRVLSGYRLPVVTLKNLNLDEVCPIFERINDSGTRLSIYDLMVAATWSRDFDLNVRTKNLATALERKDFDKIEQSTVLKVLSAIHTSSVQRESILQLRNLGATALDELVEKARGGLERAVDLLVTDFRVHSLDFLPYEAHLVILASLFSERKKLKNPELVRARQWFWRSAFSERFKGASESFISRGITQASNFISGESGSADDFGDLPTARNLLRLGFRKNGAGSRAFSLAMGKKGPRNLTNGSAIDTFAALSVYNKHQFHHIFPQAFLKRLDDQIDSNRLMNICFLSASENNEISDGDPCVYIPELARTLGGSAAGVFASSLLPNPSNFDYAKTNYDDFLIARAEIAEKWVQQLCEGGR